MNKNYISVHRRVEKIQEFISKTINIRGMVLNEKREPVIGASVLVKGTALATATNDNGIFSLEGIQEKSILIVSSIGYLKKEVQVEDKSDVTIVLDVSISPLDETVVIAYGTTTRRFNTGSVSKVSGEEISKQPVSNFLAAIEGRVPGMMISQTTGLPGSSFKVQIRGRTALDPFLTDDQPLFIIDGVPFATNNGYLNTLNSALGTPVTASGITAPGGLSPFSSIDPSDIESIEVLKDADATAIYGSRGANGVVLITTKKGKPGKTTFNFNLQSGLSKITRSPDFLSTPQYLQMRREAFLNDKVTPTTDNAYDFLVWDSTRYTDFKKLLIGGTAYFSEAQGSVSGGNELTQFFLGGNYHEESTVFPGNLKEKRGGLHFNINHAAFNQKFKIIFSGNFSSDQNNLISSDLTGLINLPPDLKIYDSTGALAWNEGGVVSGYNNPLAFLNQTYKATTDNLLYNLQLVYTINRQFTMRVNSGYNSVSLHEVQAYPITSQNPATSPVRSSNFANNEFKSWVIEPQAEYIKEIWKGKLDVLLGSTLQNQSDNMTSVSGSGYIDDALLGSLSGATNITGTKQFSQYRYEALFGRINYNLKKSYILNLSARRDGSSKFGPGRQFANFCAIGAAWIFTNGDYFSKNNSIISFGKLRGSLGTTGNDKIASYQYLDTWIPTDNSYQDASALSPSKLFNPDYSWERTNKLEGALDLGLFKDRVLFSIDYYRNRSSNQLVQYKLPTTTGFRSIVRNLPALVQNKGFEMSISSVNINSHNFSWSTSANLTIPKNILISFPNLNSSPYASLYVEGHPLNLIYGYRFLGVDPATGIYKVEDLNKDGQLNSMDYQALGSPDPKFFGGLQNNIQYKNFGLSFLFQFIKQSGANFLGIFSFPPGLIFNIPVDVLNRWQKPGDQTGIQQFTQGNSSSQVAYNAYVNLFQHSNGNFSDASFVRLKNLTFSYNLFTKKLKKWGFTNGRLYLSGQNLITVTGYKNGDPETQNYLRMPPLKTLVAGIQFTF